MIRVFLEEIKHTLKRYSDGTMFRGARGEKILN